MNVLKSDYWAYYASVFPIIVFFLVILVAYTYANAFGVSLTYLGVITFYQMMQFFQNFKNIHYYYIGMLTPLLTTKASSWPGDRNYPSRRTTSWTTISPS